MRATTGSGNVRRGHSRTEGPRPPRRRRRRHDRTARHRLRASSLRSGWPTGTRFGWSTAKYDDARLTTDTGLAREGAPVQIKGSQERVRNGYDRNGNQEYTTGRLTAWRNELLELLADGGVYLIGLYHPDRDPRSEDFVTRTRWITPEDFGGVLEGHWTEGHRPSKGEKGRVRWTAVLGGDPDV
ncbi:MAG: hypothetical protein U5K70_04315 [Halodesulfurarchaeum sp.]|nr:hypothetical protein [Halodesulfurarchaeum sp.]